MTLPESINVCGVEHKVIIQDADTLGEDILGEIDHTRAEIHLRSICPTELQQQTLIHEWVHGVLVAFGYNDESQNEHLVNALATAINLTFSLKEN